MNITKFETNFKRKLFMYETHNIYLKPDVYKEENKLINIYPFFEFQEFFGFGRCSNPALPVTIYLMLLRKSPIEF